jgi:hypothetical protein
MPQRSTIFRLVLALATATTGSLAVAQEFVTVKGGLSDDDFYRLVTCAAPPGGDCQKTVARWSDRRARDLTFGLVFVAEGFPPRLQTKIEQGLDRGMEELNASGANLRIRRAKPSEKPDIFVRLLDIPEGATIRGTGVPEIEGVTIGAATNTLVWNDNRKLVACHITSSNNASLGQVVSGMLEEITQCMGFNTDIGGRHYETRSIFSETSNALVRLGKQDIMALRRHYP